MLNIEKIIENRDVCSKSHATDKLNAGIDTTDKETIRPNLLNFLRSMSKINKKLIKFVKVKNI